MKITYFRLKGYIKVLNGMGLDEVILDFAQFKNRVILVQGENGCSKSTIIAAMTPDIDSNDSYRTDVFIDANGNRQIIEYPAEKEIHYICNNPNGTQDYYKILILSMVDGTKTRRTNKAFISKNGEELNPNGNISSFKEIRDAMMNIDPIYLDLSSITSENRGIVDMAPADRRKYLASYIGSLDTYNEIFKTISKKVNSLKSYINTLNSKISEFGQENELRLKLSQLESQKKEANKKRDELIKQLAEAETTVRLIDPDNKMQDLYVSISDRLGSLVFDLKQIDIDLIQEYTKIKISLENEDIGNTTNILNDTAYQLDFHKKNLDDNKTKISILVALNESTASAIDQDRNTLLGIQSNMIQDNLASSIESIQSQIDSYSGYITDDDIKILDSVSYEDLSDIKQYLELLCHNIKVAEDISNDNNIFISSIDLYNKLGHNAISNVQARIQQKKDIITNDTISINRLSDKCKQMKADLEDINKMARTRPAECHIDTCPYIAKYVSKKEEVSQKVIDDLVGQISVLEAEINLAKIEIMKLEDSLNIIELIDESMIKINSKLSSIKKIKCIGKIFTTNEIYEMIKNHNSFECFNAISDLHEKSNIYDILKKLINQLESMKADYKVYQNNKSMIDQLQASIEKNEKLYKEREDELKDLNAKCNFLNSLIDTLTKQKETLEKIIELLNKKKEMLDSKESLKQEFESVKDTIKLVKEKVDSLNKIKNEIANIESTLEPINDNINRINFCLTSIIDYQREYKEATDDFEKISFIRNACNPGNGIGIQSEYIKRYMNEIIIDCNKMLGYMFNGSIRLQVPIINEKQFSIPFIGPNGIIVPDITNGSTAQKCMIGLVFSCVAMMKSSTTYNIPRFDEIDGGLDQQNRIMFINVLNSILDFMGSEQCIICSHNMEFDTQSTTRVICSHTGIHIEQ